MLFYLFNNSTKCKKLYNMIFMNLTRVYAFLQVLHIKRRLSTKDDYFSTHIKFTIIYLLQKQKIES
jgi:hypothetical protein